MDAKTALRGSTLHAISHRAFSKVGVDVTEPASRKIILDGILGYIGCTAFKRRGPDAPQELVLRKILNQKPQHPMVNQILEMLHTTRISAQ